jgi:hypothetical protein
VENHIGFIDQFGQELAVVQRLEKIVHPVVFLEVPDIFHASRGKVIHQENLIAALEQALGQMRSDESRATCNEINQRGPPES